MSIGYIESTPPPVRAWRATALSVASELLSDALNPDLPIHVRRAKLELAIAITISLSSRINPPRETLEYLVKAYNTLGYRIKAPGEDVMEWFLGEIKRRDGEKVNEWISRVAILCQIMLSLTVSMTLSEAKEYREITPPLG